MIENSSVRAFEKRAAKNVIDQVKNEIDLQLIDVIKHTNDPGYCPEINLSGSGLINNDIFEKIFDAEDLGFADGTFVFDATIM